MFSTLLLTLILMAAQFNAAYSACRGIMPAEECQAPEASHCASMAAEESKTGPDCAQICRLGSDPSPAVLQKDLVLPSPDQEAPIPTAELAVSSDLPGHCSHPSTPGDDIHPPSVEVFLLNSVFLI